MAFEDGLRKLAGAGHAAVFAFRDDQVVERARGAGGRQAARGAVVLAALHAQLHVELGAGFHLVHPVQLGAVEAVLVVVGQGQVRVRRRGADRGRGCLVRAGPEAARIQEGLRSERVAVLEIPVQARRQVKVAEGAVFHADRAARLGLDAGVAVGILEHGGGALEAFVRAAARDRVRHLADLVRQLQVHVRPAHAAAGAAHADLDFALAGADRLFQHDVDGAGHRLGRELGAGGAQHFDAFDDIRRQRLDREAGRRPLAVDQDLRVAGAHAAHADFAAAAIAAVDGDAGHALEDVGDAGVAVFDDLFLVDHDLGGGVVAARIVGLGRALHFDALHRLPELGGFALLDRRVGCGLPGFLRVLCVQREGGCQRGGQQRQANRRESGVHREQTMKGAGIVCEITSFVLPLRIFF